MILQKRLSLAIIIALIIILFSSILSAQSWPNPGHPAWQIGGGAAFNASYGNFLFPSGVNLTADTSTFHVDATGDRVGIGTTSPGSTLTVVGNISSSTNITALTVCIGTDCRTSWPSGTLSGSGSAGNLSRWTGSTTLGNSSVYDDGAEKIGIGTTSPATKLHVQSGAIIGNNSGTGSFVSESGVYGTGSNYGVYGESSTYGVYGRSALGTGVYGSYDGNNFGYLGSANMGVYGQGINYGIRAYSPGGFAGFFEGKVNITGTLYASNVSSNSPLQLQTKGTTRMYINDTNGNVGIGMASPDQKLHVVGNVTITNSASIAGGSLTPNGFPATMSVGNGTQPYGAFFNASYLAVYGLVNSSAQSYAIKGETNNSLASGTLADYSAVWGWAGVLGESTISGNTNFGILGNGTYGAYGKHYGGNYGYLGSSTLGAYGQGSTAGVIGNASGSGSPFSGTGVFGSGSIYGVYGIGGTISIVGYFNSTLSGNVGDGANSVGVLGSAQGELAAVYGVSSGTAQAGRFINYGASGTGYGVYADSYAAGTNLGGYFQASGGLPNVGVVGNSSGSGSVVNGTGVFGTGSTYGVYGQYDANNYGRLGSSSTGVYGTGNSYGVHGSTASATGVYGQATSTGTGVYGSSDTGYAVYGSSQNIAAIFFSTDSASGTDVGVIGNASGKAQAVDGTGVFGTGLNYGVNGWTNSTTTGNFYGVFGHSESTQAAAYTYGVYGEVNGSANSKYGVYGINNVNGIYGYLGGAVGATGVYNANNYGYLGDASYGVYGRSNGTYAVYGSGASGATAGVKGYYASNGAYGMLGHETDIGVWGDGANYSGYFTGGEVKIGNVGPVNYIDGDGDLYIEDELEVDGAVYFLNVYNNPNTSAMNNVVIDSNGRLWKSMELSSKRYKTKISELNLGLDAVMQLHPIAFEYKKEVVVGPQEAGFIAEEVENVSPLLVAYAPYTYENGTTVDRLENVKYDRITTVLTKAVQEQQQEILQQNEQIGILEKNNALLVQEIEEIKASLCDPKALHTFCQQQKV
jgi:hypothetical protein